MRLGFRDYDPATGRFTSQYPLGDTGGDHDLYEYCVDDPVGAVDATGLDGEEVGFFKKIGGWFGKAFGFKDAVEDGFDRMDVNNSKRDASLDSWKKLTQEGVGDASAVVDSLYRINYDTARAMQKSASEICKAGIEVLQKAIPGK